MVTSGASIPGCRGVTIAARRAPEPIRLLRVRVEVSAYGRFQEASRRKSQTSPCESARDFHSLPKPVGINDLYASQAEVLDAWYARRTDKDVVVKLHTGGGKTLVALLMAQSTMNETGLPVLYLTPTNQLVGQVLTKSREYGIPAAPYVRGQPLPTDFEDGQAVLVGAYETLFSGRSKFGVRGSNKPPVKVGAIILDDAHVALANAADRSPSRSTRRSTEKSTRNLSAASGRRSATSAGSVRLTT
jgi:superfamily II DNA or RNA helicase